MAAAATLPKAEHLVILEDVSWATYERLLAEWEMDVDQCGSTTIKSPDLYKGFEPDSSFYIRNPSAVRGKQELDFTVDPPPDLVIEVDNHERLDEQVSDLRCSGRTGGLAL